MSSVLIVTLLLTVGQTAGGQSGQGFAGTWVADLAGTIYVRLELEPAGGTLRGRMALGDIQLDRQGQVNKAEAAPREMTPIFDVTLRITGISFARKNGSDTDRFQMQLLDRETADLLVIATDEMRKELAAQGIPAFKPIRLKKLTKTSGLIFGAGIGAW